jgi:peptide/nickel transport system substrate-binding protein
MKRLQNMLIAVVFGTVLLGTGATVVYFEESSPSTMNPLFAKTMVDHRSHELVFDRLFYRSSVTNELESRLVTSYEKLEGGKKLRLVLREGIKWHDNEALSAADVCFTIEAILNPKTPTTVSRDFRKNIIGCVAVAKENAAIIEFVKAYHNPRERVAFAVLPKHVFESSEIYPDHDFSTRPTGSGPMKANKGRTETRFTTFQNVHHDADIDVLAQRQGSDPMIEVSSLITQTAQGVISVPPAHRPTVAASDEVALKSYDLRSWWFMALNTSTPFLKDKRIRQAIDLALDRNELRKLTIGVDENDPNPACEFVSGPFVQSSSYYNRSVKFRASKDLAKSNALMISAGATKLAGRWSKGGNPISLRIGLHSPLDSEAKDLANYIGNQLGDAGFGTQVYKVSNDEWTRKAVPGRLAGQYDALIGKWSFGVREEVNSMFQTRNDDKGLGTQNIFNYSDPEVDKLIGMFDAARTDTEAQDAYNDLHAYLAKDLPYVFLWKLDTKSAWRNEVRGNMIAPYFYFTGFDEWKY